MEDYVLGETIGEGTFGLVCKAVHLPTARPVAVKILEKHKILSKKDLQRVKHEMELLRQVDHPNAIHLLQLAEDPSNYFIVTQLIDGQELFEVINERGGLPEREVGPLIAQLVDVVAYLHRKGICHRDIKPENILVSRGRLTLIDFGLSCRCDAKLRTSCGSPCYAAPEMLGREPYSGEKADSWAIGVTLYAMLSGRLPFESPNIKDLYDEISTRKVPPIAGVSSELTSLLESLMAVNPRARFSLGEAEAHAWLARFRLSLIAPRPLSEEALIRAAVRLDLPLATAQSALEKRQDWQLSASYFLLAEADGQNSHSIVPHKGNIHLSFLFTTLEAAKQFAERICPFSWLTPFEAIHEECFVEIKSVGPMFYAVLNKHSQHRLRRQALLESQPSTPRDP